MAQMPQPRAFFQLLACEERLPCGALVRQESLLGERLCYTRLAGAGPLSGWVNTRLEGGRDLLVRHSAASGERQPCCGRNVGTG